MKVNDEFLFGCSTGIFDNWRGTYGGDNDRKGVISRHAYSIMDAREVKGERLVLVRSDPLDDSGFFKFDLTTLQKSMGSR